MQVGVEHFHVGVSLDVAGSHLAGADGFNVDGLHAFAMQLGDDTLHVQDDLSDILLHAGDGGKLVHDTGDLDGGHRGTRQRGQQDTAQGVTQGGAVTALEGLHHILTVRGVAGIFHTFNAGLFDFYHCYGYPPFHDGQSRQFSYTNSKFGEVCKRSAASPDPRGPEEES